MRKLIPIVVLAFLLPVMGVMGVAAEMDLATDIRGETTIRATMQPLYVELPWAQERWNGSPDPHWGISGMNFGLRGLGYDPFYGLLQVNITRNVKTDEFDFDMLEFGLGAELMILKNVNIGGEVTTTGLGLQDLTKLKPNLQLFARWDFAIWPRTQT